jgi:DnaK suppressor protein
MPTKSKASKSAPLKKSISINLEKLPVKPVKKGIKGAKDTPLKNVKKPVAKKESPKNKVLASKQKVSPTKKTAKAAVFSPKKATKTPRPASSAARAVVMKKVVAKTPPPKKSTAHPTSPKKFMTKKASSPSAVKPSTVKKVVSPAAPKKSSAKAASPPKTKRPGAGPAGFLPYEAKKGEEYMGDAQLLHFQRVLHLWKEQLCADREATTKHMRDDTVNFPDPLDRAAMEEEHALEWSAREREHRLILKIDQALVTIKQGDYGYCESCGAEIGIRRLEARPTATQCIDCKTIDEIRERHSGFAD